jgi:hypothetical protein
MPNGIRTYDSNTKRKTNKQYHQLEKNIFEKNYFSYLAIVLNADFYGDGYWCEVKLVPTINFKEFTKGSESGYKAREESRVEELKTIVFKSKDVSSWLDPIKKDDVVLILFTDVNTRKTLKDLIGKKSKTSKFIENDQTKNSIEFGIIINRVL